MNFQNMEYFLTAAETGSITHAAEKLQISQQALSNNIARLEAELGCRLFDRRQRLELTYAGRKYRESAVRMLDLYKQTAAELRDISSSSRGELRIGISYTRGQAILPLILPAYIETHPLVELSVLEGSTSELEAQLEHGSIDVMIGFAPFSFAGAEFHELMKERLYLVFPRELLRTHFGSDTEAEQVIRAFGRDHDISRFADLPFVLLKEGDRIRSITDRVFAAAGCHPPVRFETKNTQTAVALAAEGVGVTICPELYLKSNYIASGLGDSYIRQRVEVCPLFDEKDPDVIAIGYNRERYLSRVAFDFIDMCTERLRSL
ncbi:MAG: LysR family transcriptional regulator [Lachnospiraceae bacterium]|nr:LysR family transcriptional regulator [Lachnospiraceae bacterium]MBR2532895.1 LysR family transcriptional regulator [Lachnospiraceae bacterium]